MGDAMGDDAVVVLVATSRDDRESYLDRAAHDALATTTTKARDDDDDDDEGAMRRMNATDDAKRIFMATRKRERQRECAQVGGLLTRACLNALERRNGATTASWGQFLRSKQRAMQRLPPGTSSGIRVRATRCIAIEHERMTFSKTMRNVGRRRGVFVGINYEECGVERWRLRRRGGDALRMREYLKTHCGYDEDDEVLVLLEDSEASTNDGSINRSCSKKAILKACRWLVDGARAGDSLFFYFSGRGQEVSETATTTTTKDSVAGGGAYKGLNKTALCASDTPGDPTARITRQEFREALRVDALPSNVHLTVFLDIYGGGGENALHDMPYTCVNVTLPDEREIKDAKNGKRVSPVTPLWMVPNGEKAVKEFLALAETAAEAYAECAETNKAYDAIKRDAPQEKLPQEKPAVEANAEPKPKPKKPSPPMGEPNPERAVAEAEEAPVPETHANEKSSVVPAPEAVIERNAREERAEMQPRSPQSIDESKQPGCCVIS